MKSCFVIGPIGADGSPERNHANWLLKGVIAPVFKQHFVDYEVIRADEVTKAGMITTDIVTRLIDADLVIADLTFSNPNVFYEIGIRHTVIKPIIHMKLSSERIPFDLGGFRTLDYDVASVEGLETAQINLKRYVESEVNVKEIDNPVTHARGQIKFDQRASSEEKLLDEKIEHLHKRVLAIEDIYWRDESMSSNSWRFYPSNLTRLSRDQKESQPYIFLSISTPAGLSDTDIQYIKDLHNDLFYGQHLSLTPSGAVIRTGNTKKNNEFVANVIASGEFEKRGLTATVTYGPR